MTSRTRRIVLIVVAAVIAWYAVVAVVATRTQTDAVPIGNIPAWQELPAASTTSVPAQPIDAGVTAVREVECGGVFDADAVVGSVPELPFPQQYNRAPCELPHRDARIVFALNTLVLLLVVAAGVFVLLRLRGRQDDDEPAPGPLVTTG